MGLPVVSTYVSGIPELVAHGETGFLVPERNATLAADAIERLIVDPGLCRDFGVAARLKVEEEFDARKTWTDFSRLLPRSSGYRDQPWPHLSSSPAI